MLLAVVLFLLYTCPEIKGHFTLDSMNFISEYEAKEHLVLRLNIVKWTKYVNVFEIVVGKFSSFPRISESSEYLEESEWCNKILKRQFQTFPTVIHFSNFSIYSECKWRRFMQSAELSISRKRGVWRGGGAKKVKLNMQCMDFTSQPVLQ